MAKALSKSLVGPTKSLVGPTRAAAATAEQEEETEEVCFTESSTTHVPTVVARVRILLIGRTWV